jgi:hypothetical protein
MGRPAVADSFRAGFNQEMFQQQVLGKMKGHYKDLILVHNMGQSCRYCTMWADGFNGIHPHLANRAAFALVWPDLPEGQEAPNSNIPAIGRIRPTANKLQGNFKHSNPKAAKRTWLSWMLKFGAFLGFGAWKLEPSAVRLAPFGPTALTEFIRTGY